MRNEYDKVTIIPKCFVSEDYVQVIFWFTNNITLINTDFNDEKILCHYDFESDSQNINKYLTDDRRINFAYHNIPIYKDWYGYEVRYNINQILDFNKHYLLIGDDGVYDIYVVRDHSKKEGVMLSRSITIPNKIKEETLYRYDILKKYKDKVLMTIDKNGHHLDFESEFDSLVDSNGGILIIKEDSETTIPNENIKFIMIDIFQNEYSQDFCLEEYTIPFNHYTLEELKYMSNNIQEMSQPKIHLRNNPNISRDDIIRAKRLARKLNRSK